MKLLYVIGPFAAPTGWLVEQNVRRAEEVALELWRMGAAVFCPHTNTRFFEGMLPGFLAGGLEVLSRSDGAVLIPGWKNSPGSQIEVDRAIFRRLPLFNWPASLDAIREFVGAADLSGRCMSTQPPEGDR